MQVVVNGGFTPALAYKTTLAATLRVLVLNRSAWPPLSGKMSIGNKKKIIPWSINDYLVVGFYHPVHHYLQNLSFKRVRGKKPFCPSKYGAGTWISLSGVFVTHPQSVSAALLHQGWQHWSLSPGKFGSQSPSWTISKCWLMNFPCQALFLPCCKQTHYLTFQFSIIHF